MKVLIEVPSVPYKGPHDTDASAFRDAADRLEGHYEVGGGNLRAAVVRLLRNTADAVEGEQ